MINKAEIGGVIVLADIPEPCGGSEAEGVPGVKQLFDPLLLGELKHTDVTDHLAVVDMIKVFAGDPANRAHSAAGLPHPLRGRVLLNLLRHAGDQIFDKPAKNKCLFENSGFAALLPVVPDALDRVPPRP